MNRLKLLLLLVFTGILCTILPTAAMAAEQVNFYIGAKEYLIDSSKIETMDVAPYIKGDRTFLPVRFVAGSLGIPDTGIIWDEKDRTVKLIDSSREVTLHIGQKEMLVKENQNNKRIIMDVAPENYRDRTMLPIRWIAEAFGVQVNWDDQTQVVSLTKPDLTASNIPEQESVGVVTGSVVNIRSGPSTSTVVLAKVKQGERLAVQRQVGDWYQISYNGSIAYITRDLVAVQETGQPSRGDGRDTLKGKKIVIDPGHGGNDPGAIGVTGLKEKDFNLDTALRLSELLGKLGAKVYLTRDKDVQVTLADRPVVANNLDADAFISIHANSSTNRSLTGTTTYYHVNSANAELNQESAKLAEIVHEELIDNLKLADKGARQDPGRGYVVLRENQAPAILVEAAFLSNKTDEAKLKSDDFRQSVADGIASGLIHYFAQL